MNTLPSILLVDPILGDRALSRLATGLKGRAEVAETCNAHTSLPSVLSAELTARLTLDPRTWDWVVSLRDGAGVAAQMVARGQARSAILLDPLTGIPELPGVAEALVDAAPRMTQEDLLRLSDVMAAVTESYIPDSYLEVVAKGLFGDDAGRSRWQELYGGAYRSRLPLDPERERQPQWWADEWVDIWRARPDAVHPWFSEGHRRVATALSTSTGIAVAVQSWSELAWLTDPEAVASALNDEFQRA